MLMLSYLASRYIKNVIMHKTDISDVEQLAWLGLFTELNGIFIPPQRLYNLRLISRQRHDIAMEMSTSIVDRVHEVLSDISPELVAMVDDIHSKLGRAKIEALLEKELIQEIITKHEPQTAPMKRIFRIFKNVSDTHVVILENLMAIIKDNEARINEFDTVLVNSFRESMSEYSILLQTIPGIDETGAALLLTEIGTDMNVFGSHRRFSSWAGLCPGKRKRKSNHTNNYYVRVLAFQFANTASIINSRFKDKFNSLILRMSPARALVVISHKILIIIFHVIKNRVPYKDYRTSN
jgi:transposase